MDTKKLLGKRLRELRIRKKITQENLSELVSVDPATISNIENGKNYPSLVNLENITKVLNVTLMDVFDFSHKDDNSVLVAKINEILDKNPEQIEVFYKILTALVK